MLLVVVVSFVAGMVQGVLGFGFGLTCMALLPLWLPVREAVPVVAVLGVALNSGLLWRYRAALAPREAAPLVVSGALGIPVGVAFLAGAPPRALLLGLAVAMLGYVALRVADVRALRALPPWVAPIVGLLGGVLTGAFNTGGPPIVLYVSSRTDWSPLVGKGVLTMFFAVMSSFTVTLFVITGLLGPTLAWTALAAVPSAVLGGWAGHGAGRHLPEAMFRRLVVAGIGIVGIVFLTRALIAP